MMNIIVHSTYHPSLTGGSFIVDKTHVQYAWPTYFRLYNFYYLGSHKNNNKHKPMASKRYKIEVQQYVKSKIENCVLLTSGVDSLKDLSKESVCDPRDLWV